MSKIKAIIKKPEDEFGRLVEIENELEVFQSIVGGYIETTGYKNLVIICNEEGKLRGLQPNVVLGCDMLVGTIIVCGASGDEFADIPIDMRKWEQIVNMSGTNIWKEFEK
ncbi:MAG: DUF3846 domain-containing protein [Mogibacterium sp.]|nr:DUF3846 domain-containing protein [Mogibacterium sp.]